VQASDKPLPPGEAGLPFLGETLEYQKQGVLKFALDRYRKYQSPVFKTSIFGQEVYMVCTLPLYQAVIAEDTRLVNFTVAGTFGKLQGDYISGVMSNRDNSRMPWRRSMLGAVTADALAGYGPQVDAICRAEVAQLASEAEWDLNETTRKFGMSFANTLLAGLDLEDGREQAEVRRDIGLFFDGLFTFDVDLPGTPLRKAFEAKARLEQKLRACVTRQLNEILAEPKVGGQPANAPKVRRNMIQYIIDARRAQGDRVDIEFLTMMALGTLQAGTDTTAASMSGLLAMVAQLPGVQARIREEQAQVAAVHGEGVSKASLDASKYLDAVVREALRLYPPSTMHWRTSEREMELDVNGGLRIPAGSQLVFNTLTAHALELNPDWLQSAQGAGDALPQGMDFRNLEANFQPERWMEPDPAKRPSLMTFGGGPHVCLGMALYIMEAKAVLATMLRGHSLHLLGPQPLTWQEMPMAKPTGAVRMRLAKLAA